MATPIPSIDLEDDSSSSSIKKSKVYQYFTYKTSRWYCNHCSKDFGNKASTTLWRHLSTAHPMIYKELNQGNPKVVGEMDKYTTFKQESVSLLFNS